MTVEDLIIATLEDIGAIDPGVGPSSSEKATGLRKASEILATFSAAGSPIHQMKRETASLTGAASYTWGSGGDINTARPLKIVTASCINGSASHPVEINTADQWTSGIRDRSRTSKFAKKLFCDYGYPLATVYLWPAPSSGSIELFSRKALTGFSSLSDTFDLPPGYEAALKGQLGQALCVTLGLSVPPAFAAAADAALGAITALNTEALGAPIPAEAPETA